MELDSYNTGRAQMYLTRSFELWCGTCQLLEKHQKTGMCRKDSLYPRTTTSQASLDYDWYTLSIRQGKRTIHNSGNWLHTAGNETTQQVTATEDAENRQLLSTEYCEKDLEQQRRTSQQHSTTSPTPLHAVHKEHRPTLQLWLVWYEQRYKTLQHENISARDLQSAQLRLDCADGQLEAKIESGTLPGDTVAGCWFLLHFHPKLDVFLQATPELQINATLPFEVQNAPESLDVGTSTYADDIIREIAGTSAENVIEKINHSNDALDIALAPDYVQNSSKQEILPHFTGRGSHAEFRFIFSDLHNLEGRVHRRVRYLGPHIAFDGRLQCETSRRTQAARHTYSLFKRFFAKTESLRWRRVVFGAMVVGVALSGLVAFTPSSTETNEVDKCLLALARKALRGAATYR